MAQLHFLAPLSSGSSSRRCRHGALTRKKPPASLSPRSRRYCSWWGLHWWTETKGSQRQHSPQQLQVLVDGAGFVGFIISPSVKVPEIVSGGGINMPFGSTPARAPVLMPIEAVLSDRSLVFPQGVTSTSRVIAVLCGGKTSCRILTTDPLPSSPATLPPGAGIPPGRLRTLRGGRAP